MLRFMQRHVDRIMATVDGPDGDRIIHVDYYALVNDPVAELLKVHARLGMDSPMEVRQAVARWHRANPKNSRGANEYSLEEYGLEEATLVDRFGNYMRRFNIPREHEGLGQS
jgi:hypothetical protein